MAAHLDLLENTRCQTFLTAESSPAIASAILAQRPMKSLIVPDLSYFLDVEATEHIQKYPYYKRFEEARYEPFVVMHTSGSTGIPKPITMTHGTFAAMDAYRMIPHLGGNSTYGHFRKDSRLFLGYPLFHAASICLLLGVGIYNRVVHVLPPAVPLTAEVADLAHMYGNVQGSALPPSVLADMSKNRHQLERLRNLQHVIYGGGPLAKEAGDMIASRTRLMSCGGSTETGLYPNEFVDHEDWDYVSYSAFLGSEYRLHPDTDELYELVIVRDTRFNLFQGVFSTFPDLQEYQTGELYAKHPTKPGYWRHSGRADHIIAFSNGEKLNPVSMEGVMTSHPAIKSALVGRQGEFQASLLIELHLPPTTPQEREALLNMVWPTVQRANQECPAHGRILRNFIIFTTAEKPMLRTDKQTVQRRLTMELYSKEFDELYAMSAIVPVNAAIPLPLKPHNLETLQDSLAHLVRTNTFLEESHCTAEADLFQLGLDSLQVISLTKSINEFVAIHRPDLCRITCKTIYAHPTIQKLERALTDLKHDVVQEDDEDCGKQMESLLERFASGMACNRKAGPLAIVLLTGSTGSLGSYLLDGLVNDPGVKKIYCLNRGGQSERCQKRSHSQKGLARDFKKVRFLQWDPSQQQFGLPIPIYASLLRKVTHIVHSAWAVNFNFPIDSFAETHIYGVRQTIDFSSQSTKAAVIFFLSCDSTVKGFTKYSKTSVPESMFDSWNTSLSSGYAKSKLIAERLLALAAQSGVRSVIYRIGQIAGPTTEQGEWNKHEWIPSVIASSKYLGKIPSSLGPMDRIDWIPVNIVSQILLELLRTTEAETNWPMGRTIESKKVGESNRNDEQTSPTVYHVTNPHTIEWSDLLPCIHVHFPGLAVVPLSEWVKSLRESTNHLQDLSQNPAAKLLSFFENLEKKASEGVAPVSLGMANAMGRSRTLATMEPVNTDWMKTWIQQWAF